MKLIIIIVLMALCVVTQAASWDIGAVQLEGSATDIGSVQAAAAAPTGGQVIFINSSMGYGFGGFGLILAWAVIKKIRNRKEIR